MENSDQGRIAPADGVPVAPTSLLLAAVLVLLEGLVSIGYGIAELVSLDSDRIAMGSSTAAFFLAFGGLLSAAAWGLYRVRTWARGPALFAQLVALGLAWNFRGGETTGISVLLAVPSVIALGALLHPQSIAAMLESEAREG